MSRLLPEKFLGFLIYIFTTIIVTYLAPPVVSQLWYVILLIIYFRSKDEPYWYAFFLILSDGCLGFFGAYDVGLSLLPGMPNVDVAQVFILLTIIKASGKPAPGRVFFSKTLQLLLIYLVFLIIWGLMIDPPSELNEIFRIFKLSFPLLMFYSTPRLMRSEQDYKRFFTFIFPIVILAFLTQIFNIIFGVSPAESLGIVEIGRYSEDYSKGGEPLRAFYNTAVTLLSLFAALFYLSREDSKVNKIYMSVIVISAMLMAFLSATRGWVIAFSVILFLYALFILKTSRILSLGIVSVAMIIGLTTIRIPALNNQIRGSLERISTVGAAASGDYTMEGTNIRTTIRSDRVLNKWKESPLFGWGFSNTYFSYDDGHVGNQSILLHSGLFGAVIMLIFFVQFNARLLIAGIKKGPYNYNKSLIVFVFFFIGWFIIHSTSGQQFSFSVVPGGAITMSLFFSFGALCLNQSETKYRREIK